MALTISSAKKTSVLGRKLVTADVTFDSSYVTGGEAIAASDFGLKTIDTLLLSPLGANAYVPKWDRTNGKIAVYSAGSEVANATDLSALVVCVFALGAW